MTPTLFEVRNERFVCSSLKANLIQPACAQDTGDELMTSTAELLAETKEEVT